ncbi:MAG: hypothetical protein U0587_20420 [Candidatus Binatia bacterium]
MPPPVKSARKWRGSGPLLAAALLLFMAFVIYRSLRISGYRCTVCIEFRGQSVCRSVDGPTQRQAHTGAVDNACAFLAGGVTDTLACGRTTPTTDECVPTD